MFSFLTVLSFGLCSHSLNYLNNIFSINLFCDDIMKYTLNSYIRFECKFIYSSSCTIDSYINNNIIGHKFSDFEHQPIFILLSFMKNKNWITSSPSVYLAINVKLSRKCKRYLDIKRDDAYSFIFKFKRFFIFCK